jgi:hypothetical protein
VNKKKQKNFITLGLGRWFRRSNTAAQRSKNVLVLGVPMRGGEADPSEPGRPSFKKAPLPSL